jgi:hypothetical protein
MVSLFSLRVPASSPSSTMSAASGSRMSTSSEAVAEVSSEMPSSEAPMASRSSAKPAERSRRPGDEVRQLGAAVVDGRQHGGHVVDDAADDLVAVGQRVRQRGGARDQALDGAALALQRLHHLRRPAG